MPTPLYPTFENRIDAATRRIIDDQVTPWAFLKSTSNFRIKNFDGKEIAYGHKSYDGSPQLVFWGTYIDQFLDAIAIEEIQLAAKLAAERKVDLKLLLSEVEGLLLSATRKVLDRMVDIDRRLRGNGSPENVKPRSAEGKFNRMRELISAHVASELEMWKPKSRFEEWHERNKFTAWLINTVLAILGLAIAIASFVIKLSGHT